MDDSERSGFPPLRYGLLHDLVGHLLRHSYNRAFTAFEHVFQEEGISPLQFMMFELVKNNPGVAHSDLAKAMGTASSVVTTTLKPMLADDRLRSRPGSADSRQRVYEASPEGLAWFEELRPRIGRSEDELTEALSEAERRELLRLLRTLLGIRTES
jgi:DNA-binding MarR family transcriptional regulator